MLQLERRAVDSSLMRWASPALALLLTVMTGFVLFLALGKDPVKALTFFFITPISDVHGLAELGLKMAPLLLCAAGLTVCYRAKLWNIGAEGHFLMGALGASAMAVWLLEADGFWVLPLVLGAGLMVGAFWAAIPAFLKTHLHCNEILTTIMLNYIALNLLLYMVHGPLKDPFGFGFPQSVMFADSALLPALIPGTRLHLGLAFGLLAGVAVWFLFSHSFIGFQLKVLGQDTRAAAFAGFGSRRLTWFAFLVGGATAGLAGASEVTGPIGQLVPQVSPGYGYTAIIVVFLGRMHALGIVAASALMALTFIGGEMLQIAMNLPKAVTGLFQGLLLFYLLTCDAFIHYRIRLRKPAVTTAGAPALAAPQEA
ncbi:ABC transporter permease [Hydrocarboniclastica marina]|nr:ABC transporter permease [Hydrocarboniclastica marina]